MNIKISTSQDGKKMELSRNKVFVASKDPAYIGIIMKPEPGIWEELMDTDLFYITFGDQELEVKIGYRIEVGESSIFFVTSEQKEIGDLISEIGNEKNSD